MQPTCHSSKAPQHRQPFISEEGRWLKAWCKSLAPYLALLFLISPGLRGQSGSTGEITGVIEDPTGAVIPNAQVTVTNEGTGTTVARLVATGAGTFSVLFLPPGEYRVEIDAPGFRKLELENTVVRVTETTNIVAKLEIGPAMQTVNVEAEASILQLSNPTTGETISQHSVENYHFPIVTFLASSPYPPARGRNFLIQPLSVAAP